MRRLLLYIGISAAAVGCRQEAVRLQTGDLLFRAENSAGMGSAIVAATGREGSENFTHVGIAIAGAGADSVLEATSPGGVQIVPLATFLDKGAENGVRPVIAVRRMRDTTGVATSVRRARHLVGAPYDFLFRHDNGAFYCSELVWECYLRPDGERMFRAQPMNFLAPDGTMPLFWIDLFEQLGEPVPQGEPGTNPNDMAREEVLLHVGRLR